MESTLTPDTQAVLLLCGELGQRRGNGSKPLGLRQYNAVASWLKSEGLRPGDLLTIDIQKRFKGLQTPEVNFDRVVPLLERGAALALMIERWERGGLWVISRSDACYPERLKRYLGQSTPPLLYGVGSKDPLNRGGLAIVGSRDRSEEDGEFARRVAEHCAQEGIAVISGAAKGIDRDAMSGALEIGGWALGVLAEGLGKTAISGQYREGLVSKHLTLVSPFDPDSRWFAYTAMERNKLLYGFSDAALVVAASADSGGTWAGATEALQRGRVKVFVKSTGTLAPGNARLLRIGGIPFPSEPWENLSRLFTVPQEKNRQLFSEEVSKQSTSRDNSQDLLASEPVRETADVEQVVLHDMGGQLEGQAQQPVPEFDREAYVLVIDEILGMLQEPQTEKWLAGKLKVRTGQMQDWLNRAVREGRIKKLKKPILYVASDRILFNS